MDRARVRRGEKKGGAGQGAVQEGAAKKGGFLTVSPLAPLPLLCFLALNKGPFFPCALLAALLHELGHIAAIYLSGGRVVHIGIYPFGAQIVTGGSLLSYGQSLFVALSGAGVNLLCALPLLFRGAPPLLQIFSVCSLGLALFNLLPLKRLDGGEALYNLCALTSDPDKAGRICKVFSLLGSAGLLLIALAGVSLAKFNPTLLLLALYLLWGVF